jgi:hypothetical protein
MGRFSATIEPVRYFIFFFRAESSDSSSEHFRKKIEMGMDVLTGAGRQLVFSFLACSFSAQA